MAKQKKKKTHTNEKGHTVSLLGKGCVCEWGVRAPSKLSSHEEKLLQFRLHLHRGQIHQWPPAYSCLFFHYKIILLAFYRFVVGFFLRFAFFSIFTQRAAAGRSGSTAAGPSSFNKKSVALRTRFRPLFCTFLFSQI